MNRVSIEIIFKIIMIFILIGVPAILILIAPIQTTVMLLVSITVVVMSPIVINTQMNYVGMLARLTNDNIHVISEE